jgi:hypothetical protein
MSCDDLCDETSVPVLVKVELMVEVQEVKDGVVEVAVLLLDRKVKTEFLFPDPRSRRSGEPMSRYVEESDCGGTQVSAAVGGAVA